MPLHFSLALLGIVWGMAISHSAACAGEPQEAVAQKYVVVTDSPHATRIGTGILARGGNAVDAAVAVGFALSVTWPEAGNIGGGGFMLVHEGKKDSSPVCIDYREVAPLAATEDMYEAGESTFTTRAVGVPGTVRGLALAHKKYGKLPWRELVAPAAALAREGFEVDEHLARSLNWVLDQENVQKSKRYAELRRVYGRPGGGEWKPGDKLVLPDLAGTLALIAEKGPEAFYEGPLAEKLVAEMRRTEGLITAKDLKQYQPKLRDCIRGEYRGYTIYGPPPPSSGGICLVEALNILEQFPQAKHPRQSPEMIHLMAETLRRVFRDRAQYLGDSDFVEIPEFLTQPAHAREWAATIDMQHATPSEELAGEIRLADESPDTTHFSIVDASGMAVSNTYTLEASWGSRVVVPGAGYLLNNQMGDFNWIRGRTNRAGRIGTEPNLIEPGKRMLSSQCPTIVCRDGLPVLVTGSPGGRSIISTVLCVVVNHIDYGMSPKENIAAARMHHQWFPDVLVLERAGDREQAESVKQLEAWGHDVVAASAERGQGSAHSIWIDQKTGRLHGIADGRRGGLAAGG